MTDATAAARKTMKQLHRASEPDVLKPLIERAGLTPESRGRIVGHASGLIADLRAAIAHCEGVSDYVSRELFEKILADEEDHVDWLETQLDLIERLGEQIYLQKRVS